MRISYCAAYLSFRRLSWSRMGREVCSGLIEPVLDIIARERLPWEGGPQMVLGVRVMSGPVTHLLAMLSWLNWLLPPRLLPPRLLPRLLPLEKEMSSSK